MFRRHDRRADPRWDVAASTQVFSADLRTVVALVREVDAAASEAMLDGVLLARSHPTGWFLWAVRRDDLRGEDLAHFNELVTVRTYLLLRQGPVPRVWRATPGGHEWRSPAASLPAELPGMAPGFGA